MRILIFVLLLQVCTLQAQEKFPNAPLKTITGATLDSKQILNNKTPLVISFWATWCKNCAVMDKTVLKDPAVVKRLENHVKIKYQAEELTAAPAKDVAARFQVLGLPTYVVLKPKG